MRPRHQAEGRRRHTGAHLVLVSAIALVSCVGVEYPRAGESPRAQPGQSLVYGRVRLMGDGREFYPFRATNVLGPELHLWLLRLDARRVSPELLLEDDGTFRWRLSAGDYALVGNRHRLDASDVSEQERQDDAVLALLRVPGSSATTYAGDLVIEAGSLVRDPGLRYSYAFGGVAVAVNSDGARAALEHALGKLEASSEQSLFCTGDDVPAFDDPQLARRGRALLDSGCPQRRLVPP